MDSDDIAHNCNGSTIAAHLTVSPTDAILLTVWKGILVVLALLLIAGVVSFYLPPTISLTSAAPDTREPLTYEISNRSLLPVVFLEFDCTLQHGAGPSNSAEPNRYDENDDTTPEVLREHVSMLSAREITVGRCDAALPPARSLPFPEFVVFLRYWSPPVPFRRSMNFVFVPVRDASGKVAKYNPR